MLHASGGSDTFAVRAASVVRLTEGDAKTHAILPAWVIARGSEAVATSRDFWKGRTGVRHAKLFKNAG